MPRAEILIEDGEHGADVRFVFKDGFVPASNAHQLAAIIKTKLDEMCSAGYLTETSEQAGAAGEPDTAKVQLELA